MAWCCGPLAGHLDEFATFLAAKGYASDTIKAKRTCAAYLSSRIGRDGLSLARLNEAYIEQFLAQRRTGATSSDRATGASLLEFLRSAGVTAALRPKIDTSPVGRLTRRYEDFLLRDRGLASETVTNYMRVVKRFLTECFKNRPRHLQDLTPKDLHRFILSEAQRTSRNYARNSVAALRSFLRFLYQHRKITRNLADALPGIACWRLSHIPKSLASKDIEKILLSCERNSPVGQRNYAILLLLARLGLRASEVSALTLDDVDWKHGEILLRGKGRRLDRLPLPQEVGSEIVKYLRHVRPTCPTRNIFIRMNAPLNAVSRGAISHLVHCALQRAGLSPALKGPHLFRHSLATNMMRDGASLSEIGQLLRHQNSGTTQIYAKLDLESMRDIGLPWMNP